MTVVDPETTDTDFTWSEFVRRNNDELVGTWGNLVHRTLVNAHRNFGAVPEPGELTERDRDMLAAVETGFDTVGGLIYHRIGGVPSPGEVIEVDGLSLTVESTDGSRVGKVLVARRPKENGEARPEEDGDR